MKTSIIKFVLFCLVISTAVFGVKTSLNDYSEAKSLVRVIDSLEDSSVVFLGSSRIRNGINENILNEFIPARRHYNLGISSGTFLSNNVVADLILENSNSDLIVVELSPIVPSLPLMISELLDEHPCDFLNISNRSSHNIFSFYDNAFLLNFYSSELFAEVSLLDAIRRTRDINAGKFEPSFGYTMQDKNNYHDTDLFLTLDDLTRDINGIDLRPYEYLITRLRERAARKGARVVYLLPVTFNRKTELDILLPVYNAIPDSSKIIYDQTFFEEITRGEYLLDRNHFNTKGAEVYTRQIIRLLEKKYKITSPDKTEMIARAPGI